MVYKAKKLKGVDDSSLAALGQSVKDLSQYIEDEFGFVASAAQDLDPEPIRFVLPPKPRRGTIAYADGTHWNPGNGEGPYYFNGTSWIAMFPISVPVLTVKKQIFTASGTYTPSAGMLYCIAEGVGGGGGGGGVAGAATLSGGGGGGGAGGYSRSTLTAAAIGGSQIVTIGAFGPGGAAGANNGSPGGDTSLGALVIAKGGSGGLFCSSAQLGVGGVGGVVGTGDIAAGGASGTYGGYNSSRAGNTALATPGTGGSSIFGGGATNTASTGTLSVNGTSAKNYGSGGGGAFIDAVAGGNASGGNGSPGIMSITEFCSQ